MSVHCDNFFLNRDFLILWHWHDFLESKSDIEQDHFQESEIHMKNSKDKNKIVVKRISITFVDPLA